MDTMKRVKLHHLREKFVQDLDVKDVVDNLLANGALDEEDYKEIMSEKVRTDQTRHLLDLLPRKGPGSTDLFIESLKSDYNWLYEEFTKGHSETDSVDEKTFYDAFLLGGVPHPPPYNVERRKNLSTIQRHLKALQRGSYIVLHGMTGSGKSCLAAAAVDNREILMKTFKGSVYWLTLGEYNDEDLVSSMNQLLQRLKLSNSHFSGSPVDDKIIMNKERAKEELKQRFLEESLREGLLILDDVTSFKQVEAFDIGCKILITTKDELALDKVKGRYNLVKMNEGLTEKESLSLLAQSLGIQVDQIPQQGRKIHVLSQGSPMIMALIAGQLEDNKEDAVHSEGRWEYYVDMLSQKNFSPGRRSSFLAQSGLFLTISMSINNLPDDKKEYYKYFALFMEDVNIKPEVLQTLWSLETKYEVEDIMAYFTKKSLAVCKWNEQFCSSVYGIHDLLLHYLKEQLTCNEKIDLHKNLLFKYREKCNGNYAMLPNDNYIFSYIGYHMYHAEEYELFHQVFLDLHFIQSKLRVAGPADVLADFKKYRDLIICEGEELIDKFNDFVRFIQLRGLDIYRDHNVHIVQYGLLEVKESWVYKEALKIAKMSPHKMFFDLLYDDDDLDSHPKPLPLSEEIVIACFTNEMSKILVADGNGLIWLWGLDSFKIMRTYRGHHSKINHIELHPDNEKFVSCCEDGTLKLWSLASGTIHERIELNNAGHNLRVSSPQSVQRNWKSMFLNDSPKDESIKTFERHNNPVLSAKFSQLGREIVSCSKDACIVWNCETSERFFMLKMHEDSSAICCTFLSNDSVFVVGVESKINIYDSKTSDFLASFCHFSTVIAVFSAPSEYHKLIVVSKSEIRIWQWDVPEISNPIEKSKIKELSYPPATFSLGKINFESFGKREDSSYICAAFSRDGSYLVTASTDFLISVWNVRMKTLILRHKNSGLATCLDTYVDELPCLLCGSDYRTVKVWYPDQCATVPSTNLLPCFDSVWIRSDDGYHWNDVREEEWLPIIISQDSTNKLQILEGNRNVAESSVEDVKIVMCAIAKSACSAFYGCSNGTIKRFDVTHKTSEVIMKLDSEVVYLQYLEHNNQSLVVAADLNSLKIWNKGTSVLACSEPTGPVVQSFLISHTEQLMVCYQNAEVKLWDITSGKLSHVIVGRATKANVTFADFCYSSNKLVLMEAHSFHVALLALYEDFPFVNFKSSTTKRIQIDNSTASCCKISPQGELLAIGLHSGFILLWNFKTLQYISKVILHESPVHNIIFTVSNKLNNLPCNSVLMVTVGSKIGWWNVSSLTHEKVAEVHDVNNCKAVDARQSFWEFSGNRRKKKNDLFRLKEERNASLLGSIKLIGAHALKISASPDSLRFLTIDTSGIIYLLKVV